MTTFYKTFSFDLSFKPFFDAQKKGSDSIRCLVRTFADQHPGEDVIKYYAQQSVDLVKENERLKQELAQLKKEKGK